LHHKIGSNFLNHRKRKLLLCTTKPWTFRNMTDLKSLLKLIMSCLKFVFCERSVTFREWNSRNYFYCILYYFIS